MNVLSNVRFKPLQNSIYMKPLTMCFNLNGMERTWDLLEVHNSVVILIYNVSRNVLVFVKQFRPAVYYYAIPPQERLNQIDIGKYPAELGVTIELCAGIIDKKLSVKEIAKEEVLEECGYDVNISNLQQIFSYPSNVGSSGSTQTAFYCEVTDDMRITQGGGVEDESIEVIEMTIPDVMKYISKGEVTSPPSFLFGVYWFLQNKKK